MSKVTSETKEPTALIVMELHDALEGVINMLDTPTPAYIQKLLDKYEEKYENSKRGTN